jgi:hypothetical protein
MASMAMQNLDTLIYDAAASLDEGLFFFVSFLAPSPFFFSFFLFWNLLDKQRHVSCHGFGMKRRLVFPVSNGQ